MSFHHTAEEVFVEHGHILKARLRDQHGHHHHAEIDLNHVIGNHDGHFSWGGHDFAHSAQNIHFSYEGGAHVPVLRADLRDAHGHFVPRDINLAERIHNENGRLVFH